MKDHAGLLTCDDPAPPLYQDVEPKVVQDAIVMSTLCPSYASFHSPCPKASWSSERKYQSHSIDCPILLLGTYTD